MSHFAHCLIILIIPFCKSEQISYQYHIILTVSSRVDFSLRFSAVYQVLIFIFWLRLIRHFYSPSNLKIYIIFCCIKYKLEYFHLPQRIKNKIPLWKNSLLIVFLQTFYFYLLFIAAHQEHSPVLALSTQEIRVYVKT